MRLNDQQQSAVVAPFRPILVVAGAGTGKTRVLIERIVYYIRNGIDPRRILAITFTNKARDEIRSRIIGSLKGGDLEGHNPRHIYTFHGFFYYLLRRDIIHLGREANFRVIDENDQRNIFRRIIRDLNIQSEELTPRRLTWIICELKLINPYGQPLEKSELMYSFLEEYNLSYGDLSEIYSAYSEYLREINALDYDDLQIMADRVLDLDHVRHYWSSHFSAILVDEFQDTNGIQFSIVKKLVNTQDQNIFCVGDPDQSIYGWRGAKPGICQEFLDTFAGAQVIKLEENYRSTKNILAVANHLINKVPGEFTKVLFTQNEEGPKVFYKEINPFTENEITWVLNEIARLRRKYDAKLSDFAILYRNNSLAIPFESELNKRRIPFSIVNSYEFFSREEVKVMISYLMLLFKDHALDALERARSLPPRGIGGVAMEKFARFKKSLGCTVLQALIRVEECGELTKKTTSAFREFGKFLSGMIKHRNDDLHDLTLRVFEESGYRDYLEGRGEHLRIENVVKLAEILSADKTSGNEEIISELSLKSSDANVGMTDFLLLSTVHQSKGLEYRYVFIVKMVKDIFPSAKSRGHGEQSSEERRLAYVAFTRARERLYIIRSPLAEGNIGGESEFVTEIKGLPAVKILRSENFWLR